MTEWSKSEREKHISYINIYNNIYILLHIDLEKWHWGTYVQGRNRDADVKNRLMDTAVEGKGGMNWEAA